MPRQTTKVQQLYISLSLILVKKPKKKKMNLQTQSVSTRFLLPLFPSNPNSNLNLKPKFLSPKPKTNYFKSISCSLSTVSSPTSTTIHHKPFPAEVSRTIIQLSSIGTLSTIPQNGWPLGIGVRFAVDAEGTPVLCLPPASSTLLSHDKRSSLHVQVISFTSIYLSVIYFSS